MTVEERIRQDIEQRIHSGEWKPGHRIPFEHELVTSYSCARATVSKALTSLAKARLIERRRKAGSFVAHPQVHSAVLAIPDLSEMVAKRGEVYRWSLLIRHLGTSETFPHPSVYVEGVHFAGVEPFALEKRWINRVAVPTAEHHHFEDEAPGTWLLQEVPWTAARHRIRAIAAEASEAKTLGVRPRTACLELQRLTWRYGEHVTMVRQLFRGDRFDLVAEFQP